MLEEAKLDCVTTGNLAAEANVLQHIGGCYLELGKLDEADRVLGEALEKATKAEAQQLTGWIFNDLARVEIQRNEWGQALELARRSRVIADITGDQEAEANTLMTEALVRSRMGHWTDSVKIATQALTLYTQNDNLRQTVHVRRHLSKLLNERQRFDEARAMLGEALRTAVRLHLERYQVLIHLDMAKLEIENRDYQAAHQHAVTARLLAEEEELTELLNEADAFLGREELA